MTHHEEPTRLQEDQTEPPDEPDRIYEAEFEKRAEALMSLKTTVSLDRPLILEVWDVKDGQLIEDSVIDHIEVVGNKLAVEIDSEVRLP